MMPSLSGNEFDTIREGLLNGMTTSQIADLFPDRSRNSIVGFVRRDPALNKIGFKHIHKRPSTSPAPPKGGASLVEHDVVGVALIDLESKACRWPVNDRDVDGKYLFCGARSADQKPYCAKHLTLSIGSGTVSERDAGRYRKAMA